MMEKKFIVIHCSAGPQNQRIEDMQGYWRSLGWKTDGYHHVIKADGEIVNLVPIDKAANGVKGHNEHSIHICYLGGVEIVKGVNDKGKTINKYGKAIDNRTPQQKASMEFLVKKYKRMFPKALICGHRDFSPDKNRDGIIQPSEWMKACPSFSVSDWIKTIPGINQPDSAVDMLPGKKVIASAKVPPGATSVWVYEGLLIKFI